MWLDLVWQLLAEAPNISEDLRAKLHKTMLRCSKNSGFCPQGLMVENVQKLGNSPLSNGRFGDVYKGEIKGSETVVCLKVVRTYLTSDDEKLSRDIMREAIIWQQLEHPNVVPFIGICYMDSEAQKQLSLISPWMDGGSLPEFLRTTPREDVDHFSLVYDIASGLSYLHRMNIVHRDLKGANILVTRHDKACIGDFGLSRLADPYASQSSALTTVPGTMRWLAPELLGSDSAIKPSSSSDVYSYGCVCYEVFTGQFPLHEYEELKLITAIMNKEQPSYPKEPIDALTDEIWNIMTSCWNPGPENRPTAANILNDLSSLNHTLLEPVSDQDTTNLYTQPKTYLPLNLTVLEQLQRNVDPYSAAKEVAASFAKVLGLEMGVDALCKLIVFCEEAATNRCVLQSLL
ncbi:kinase-like protein [Marasmius fiardii PR-910]|nr:kinase-like protein [Marasmius fiardii PR-910]